MRRTRSAYHYAIRDVRKREREIINERFTDTILNNQSRNFWDEVKKIRSSSKGRSSSVDGLTCSEDVANRFAEKYQDLYTNVPYDVEDMTALYEELHKSTVEDGFDNNCTVSFHEVMSAVHRLKSGK